MSTATFLRSVDVKCSSSTHSAAGFCPAEHNVHFPRRHNRKAASCDKLTAGLLLLFLLIVERISSFITHAFIIRHLLRTSNKKNSAIL